MYFQQIAAVTVAGTYDVSGSTLVSGGALIVTAPIADLGADLNINGGTVDITTAQSFSFTSVEILNGTLSGAGSVNVTITGSMSWDQGTISGLGTLTIASGATLSLGGPQRSIERLDGTTLDNAGTANLTSVFYTDGMMLEDGAGIDNEPGGSFTFLGNSHPSGGAYIYSDSSPTFFTNEGSLILRRNRERPDIHPNRILYRDEHGVDSTERRLPRVRRKCHVQRLDHCRHWHDAHVRRSVDEVRFVLEPHQHGVRGFGEHDHRRRCL